MVFCTDEISQVFAFSTLEVSVESADGQDTLAVAAESSGELDTLDDTVKGLGEAGEPCGDKEPIAFAVIQVYSVCHALRHCIWHFSVWFM